MSFTNKINNYTNTTTGLEVTDAINKGIDFTIGVTANLNPDMLRLFASKIDLNDNAVADYDVMEIFNLSHIIDVKRGSKFCRPITDRQLDDVSDITSIYYAVPNDPVYFISGAGRLTIKPEPKIGNTTKATIYGVHHSKGRTIVDATEKITTKSWGPFNSVSKVTLATDDSSFPDVLYELVIMHASECILMERLADFRSSIPTGLDAEWLDALTKAKTLFDSGATIEGDNAGSSMSVQYWLNDEDEDMSGATLQAISSEMNRANAYLSKFKTDIEVLSVDYQWTSTQLQMLGQKKQEFIQTHLKLGPQGSPEGEAKV
tara:strand:- start:1099 stop:2049 length:951 start_codon:yes stop_codon:yes gene_type:complete